jgi:hypothetical protein
MARSPLNLDARQIPTTALTELYLAPAGVVTSGLALVLTNTVATTNEISVFHDNGTTDFLIATRTLPGGSGKTWMVSEVSGLKLNAGDSIKVQSGTATAYNSNLSGSEVTG